MKCAKDESKLSAWVDGELSDDDASELRAHVETCLDCTALVASFRAIGSALERELAPEPDPAFVVRFRARRDELSIAPWWTWRQLALRLAPLAAAALLLAWFAVMSSTGPASAAEDLQVLELEALGSPELLGGDAASMQEPVLSIALGSFPDEVP